ncbi:LCP family protein [Saccharopolyspora rectivirgula]|jgi:LCP family protein required for cell wall assembly|uniref:LCP family protein n=1 Tax=Saccharopolyspora rectivirgula TaxID=28042 RepID=UPI000425565C|nr:LCP family protein [Saccharopolyspora rectivirgula]
MSDWSAGEPPRARRPHSEGKYDYYRAARGSARPARDRGQPPPRRGGNRPPQPPPPPARKPKRWGRRIGITLLVLVLALAGLVVYFDNKLQRIEALSFDGKAADSAGTNWLLVGSDSREGLTEEQREQLSAGNAAGRRTDTMMLVHIPAGGGQPVMVSLPRDSYVPIPGHGRTRLNHAYAYGGPPLLAQTIEQVTGVHIDHYAEVGFGGFVELVDAVGGVDICLDKPINDDRAHVQLPAGCQELDGPTALGFVRARYSLEGGDFERAENQRKLLGALVDKATSPATLLNPFRIFPMASQATQMVLVDDSDHLWHMLPLMWAMRDISAGNGATISVPFAGFGTTDSGQSVVLWDRENALRLFDAIANDEPIPQDLLD